MIDVNEYTLATPTLPHLPANLCSRYVHSNKHLGAAPRLAG